MLCEVLILFVPVPPLSKFVSDFVKMIRSDTNEGFTDVSKVHVSPQFLFDGVFGFGFEGFCFVSKEVLDHLSLFLDSVSAENIR